MSCFGGCSSSLIDGFHRCSVQSIIFFFGLPSELNWVLPTVINNDPNGGNVIDLFVRLWLEFNMYLTVNVFVV